MTNLLLLFLVTHVIGDFYLQSEAIARNKNKEISKLLMHGAVYMISLVGVAIFFRSYNLSVMALYIGLAHIGIDLVKFGVTHCFEKNHFYKVSTWWHKEEKRGSVYLVDQVLHGLSIGVIVTSFTRGNYLYGYRLLVFMDSVDVHKIMATVLMFLLILKPVNITFRKLFMHTKPEEETFGANKNVGQMIGNLERMLVLVLMMLGQYTAIGLVFTAKSISRYNKIAESQAFAEYYLLGTLFSMLSTVLIYMVIKG